MWSTGEIVKLTGLTSRTLRHYDEIGLLAPAKIGSNGLRLYDEQALKDIQRILVMRDLGLSLSNIKDVLQKNINEITALEDHLMQLRKQLVSIKQKIRAIEHTLDATQRGTRLNTEKMFDGFTPSDYKEEVENRWGKEAYTKGAAWWTAETKRETEELNAAWVHVARNDPQSDAAQAVAKRHVEWLKSVQGTPAHEQPESLREYVLALAEMYVADDRFAKNYGGKHGAEFVSAALKHLMRV